MAVTAKVKRYYHNLFSRKVTVYCFTKISPAQIHSVQHRFVPSSNVCKNLAANSTMQRIEGKESDLFFFVYVFSFH
jgi:hypothetical protein